MSQAAFALLHPGVQRVIWEMGWKQLRPIQAEAIQTLLDGSGHLLICAASQVEAESTEAVDQKKSERHSQNNHHRRPARRVGVHV